MNDIAPCRAYISQAGKAQFKPSLATAKMCEEEDVGFCLACGDTSTPAELDAVRYECECCGEEKVYGVFELAMRGLVY